MTTIRRYGTPLVRQPNGAYHTEDGRYEVTSDSGYLTMCDNPHPIRNGGYCHGFAEHTYTRWHIWDLHKHDYAFGDSPGEYGSFKEAAESLTYNLTREASNA